jgi:hypothetical protein
MITAYQRDLHNARGLRDDCIQPPCVHHAYCRGMLNRRSMYWQGAAFLNLAACVVHFEILLGSGRGIRPQEPRGARSHLRNNPRVDQ